MSFWTDKTLEPKRSYRFRLKSQDGIGLGTGNGIWWNAKKVDKPSFSVSSNKYRLVNHEINVPGIVSWNPINIEIADVKEEVDTLVKHLSGIGYNPKKLESDTGIAKSTGGNLLGLEIQQLGGDGKPLDVWKLEGAFISEVRFGSLDYTSDEIVTISLTVTYDHAYLKEE